MTERKGDHGGTVFTGGLVENIGEVARNSLLAQNQPLSDSPIGEASYHQAYYLYLSRGQSGWIGSGRSKASRRRRFARLLLLRGRQRHRNTRPPQVPGSGKGGSPQLRPRSRHRAVILAPRQGGQRHTSGLAEGFGFAPELCC